MKMKKVMCLLLALVLVFSLAACSGGDSGSSSETPSSSGGDSSQADGSSGSELSGDPIKIGLITVLTGDRAMEGEYGSNTVEILTEEINANGGVLGRPVEIVMEDGLGTEVGAVNAFRKLADDPDIVAIVGSDQSNDNIAIAPEAESYEILTTAQGSSPTLRDICFENPWMFQIRPCDETLNASLMAYAVEENNHQTFAVIHDTDTAATDNANLFIDALATYGIEPELVLSYPTGTKDFTSHLVQIQQSGVDAVISTGSQTEGAILLQQMRSLGMTDMPVYGSNAYADPLLLELAGDAANGVYSVSSWVTNTPNEIGKALADEYYERFGQELGKTGAQVYDNIKIICEAIERAGTTDRAAVRDAMTTIDSFQGAITTYDCRTNGDCGRGGLLVKIENGEAVILQEIMVEKEIAE